MEIVSKISLSMNSLSLVHLFNFVESEKFLQKNKIKSVSLIAEKTMAPSLIITADREISLEEFKFLLENEIMNTNESAEKHIRKLISKLVNYKYAAGYLTAMLNNADPNYTGDDVLKKLFFKWCEHDIWVGNV